MKTLTNLNLSKHSTCRAQQRGITIKTLDFVMFHADVWLHAREGNYMARISQKRLASLSRKGSPASLIERATNIVLIIDPDSNRIITVLHDDGSKRSRRYRAQWPSCTEKNSRRSHKRKDSLHIVFGPYPKADVGTTFH